MKITLIIGLFLSIPFFNHAQQEHGTILYEARSGSSLTMNGVAQNLPEKISRYQLLYSPEISLFRNVPSTDEDEKFQNNGVEIGFKVNNNLRIQYHDFKNKLRLNTEDLGGQEYLVKDGIPELNWLTLTETKTIQGYDCKKASGKLVRKDWIVTVHSKTVTVTQRIDTVNVVAWYAPSIPQMIGPDKYTGLPGAILAVENNKGKTLFEAVSISGNLKQKELKAPGKGKLISAAGFEAEQKKYREESTKALNGIQ
ncbi:MAG: hypothetical protein JWN76_2488 [Chitinophagaceae bacterium]|nr:hypothetical protein [Chitinophagaceae bacterium]